MLVNSQSILFIVQCMVKMFSKIESEHFQTKMTTDTNFSRRMEQYLHLTKHWSKQL